MKSGDLEYRKTLDVKGELHVKRIGMVSEGELFGHEDLFNQTRTYTVGSCMTKAIVYKIPK